jgi:hypothetical protein
MSFFLRLLHRQAFSVSLNKADSTFLYRERGRRLRVPGEAMADGFAVYASAIRQWESPPGATPAELIDDNERQRIATNIRNHFVGRGKNVYLS